MKRSHSYNSNLNYSLSNDPIKLAIIGAGRAGEFHVDSLSINKQFSLLYIGYNCRARICYRGER